MKRLEFNEETEGDHFTSGYYTVKRSIKKASFGPNLQRVSYGSCFFIFSTNKVFFLSFLKLTLINIC